MQGPEAPSATFIVMAVALSVVSAIVGLLLVRLFPLMLHEVRPRCYAAGVLLQPRPRWLVHWKAGHPLWYASPTGSYLRKLALALNGAMVVRCTFGGLSSPVTSAQGPCTSVPTCAMR